MVRPSRELLRVELELWHPDCWTTEVMAETGAGVLGHGSVIDGRRAYERCTIYGDSVAHVGDAIETAMDSTRINRIQELQPAPTASSAPKSAIATHSQDVFIEYEFTEGIGPAFCSQGFVLVGQSQMEDGREAWPLVVEMDRAGLGRRLDDIRKEYDAEITVEQVSPASRTQPRSSFQTRFDELTPRQRQAYDLARANGYYEWPRETSVQELADELGVSKTTFLEHLRLAENQLLDPPNSSHSSQ